MLKQRATTDENWSVRRAAVQELARGWKTLALLRKRARRVQDEKVREFAKKELGKRGVKISRFASLLRFFPFTRNL